MIGILGAGIIKLAMDLAPTVAGWIAGDDAEEKTNQIVGLAKQVTGMDTEEGAEAALRQNPELMVQFRVAILDHQFKMATLELENTRAYLRDVQDARKAAKTSYADEIMGVFLCVLMAFLLYKVFNGIQVGADRDLVMLITGVVLNEFKQYTSFLYGSAKGATAQTASFQDALMTKIKGK